MAKKKKSPYKKGGVIGTAEYSKRAYKKGGVVGTSDYSKNAYQDGGVVKRKGYSDGEGKRLSYKNSADHSYDGKAYGGRKGWGDKEGSRIGYSQRGGSAQNSEKFKKRRGYSDHGVEHAYEDGGVVGAAKRSALMGLKAQMMEMGGDSLFDSLDNPNAYEDGGIVESHEEENDNEDSGSAYDELTREELIRLLNKNS